MRSLKITLLISLLFLMSSGIIYAAVESSPHDINALEVFTKDQLIKEKSSCSYCHPAFEDAGTKIWKKLPKSLKKYGNISPRCYSCHDGVAIVDINVDASRTAFSKKSHAFFQERIFGGSSKLGVNLGFLGGKPLDCTTCHDIHNNDSRPFLIKPLSSLCFECHSQRMGSGFGKDNRASNHPVDITPTDATGGETPISPAAIFKTPYPQPYPLKNGKQSKGTHWDLGGHLSLGDVGNIECYTCHSVHGNELSGPNDKLMTVDPVNEVNNVFCESCHRGKRGDGVEPTTIFPNPGGTEGERTYHPVDDDIANGPGRIVEITEPEDWPFGSGPDKNLLCNTCHDVHFGLPDSPMLRTPTGDTFCEECHEEKPEGHHQTGENSNPNNRVFATTGYEWTYENEVKWENGNPIIILEADIEAESDGYGRTYGKNIENNQTVENKIYCSSCHRAHNAGNGIEKKAAPSLVISHTANQLCFLCHSPTNIAFNTNLARTASHFLGDPTSVDTYEKDPNNLHTFTEEWPETGLESKFGGDNEYEIICQTCHTFNKDNLDAQKYNYNYDNNSEVALMLIARADENLEWTSATEKEKETTETSETESAVDESYHLCIGCHSSDPGKDEVDIPDGIDILQNPRSHPMMGLDGKMPNGEMIDRTNPDFPMTYTPRLNINCMSCHSIHKADIRGGVYIIKKGARENNDPLAIRPNVDYTPLCALCHKNK